MVVILVAPKIRGQKVVILSLITSPQRLSIHQVALSDFILTARAAAEGRLAKLLKPSEG